MLNQSANVEGILGSQIARMSGVYLTTGLVIVLFLLQSRDLGLGQTGPGPGVAVGRVFAVSAN